MLGKAELDQLLADRERLNEELQKIIDESTEPWGVKVTAVEIKDVEIPEQMQRAMARQAEAERERRAKIINSEGEFQAAQKLTDAADIISTNPASLQLRYLQTLLEIGSNQNTTVVFPLPMDVLEPFVGKGAAARAAGTERPARPAAPPPRRRPSRRQPTSPTQATSPPPAPELAGDPHRPADRAEDDPRPGPGCPPRQLLAALDRAEGTGQLPLLRGPRGPHAAGALRAAAGGGEPDTPGLEDARRPEPLPGARRARARFLPDGAGATRRAAAEAGSFASSRRSAAGAKRAGEPDLFSSRPARARTRC